jgi:hypothetical protein
VGRERKGLRIEIDEPVKRREEFVDRLLVEFRNAMAILAFPISSSGVAAIVNAPRLTLATSIFDEPMQLHQRPPGCIR